MATHRWHIADFWSRLGGLSGIWRRQIDARPPPSGVRVVDQSHHELAEAQRLARIGSWHWDIARDRVTWSETLYEIFGVDPARAPPTYEQHPAIYASESFARLDAAVGRAITDGESYNLELEVRHASGEPRWIISQGEAIRDASGRIVGLRGTALDITQRKQIERALSDSESRFRLSMDNAPIGKALVGLDGRFLHVNQALCRMLGYTEEALLAKTFQDITHPDDLALDLGHLQQLLCGASDRYCINKRYFGLHGTQVEAQLDVTLLRDAGGEPIHFISQVQDITERSRLQEQQQVLTQRLTMALRTSGLGVWDWHVGSGRIEWDDAMYRIYGVAPGSDVDYAVWRNAVLPEDLARAEEGLQAAIAQKATESREFRIRHPRFGLRYIEASYGVVLDGNQNVMRVVGVNLDVTEQWQAEQRLSDANRQLKSRIGEVLQLQERLREQAVRDGLTGLYNRRHFDELLATELQRLEPGGAGLSLILVDVDHFKAVNDRYGHQAGDRMLKVLGDLMRSSMRGSDVVCRYGGEEFAVVLRHCSLEIAVNRAELLRNAMAALVLRDADQTITATLSLGVAHAVPGFTADSLLRAADQALYQAKQQGRNRSVCAAAA